MQERIREVCKLSQADYTEIRIEGKESTHVIFHGKGLEATG